MTFFKKHFFSFHLLYDTFLHKQERTVYLESSFFNFFACPVAGKLGVICKDIFLLGYRESALACSMLDT